MCDEVTPDGGRLLQLARQYGVEPNYLGHDGLTHAADAQTLVAVLAAMGVDASSPGRIEAALQNAELVAWRRVLPPIVVMRSGRQAQVPVHVTHGESVTAWLELDAEAGGGRRELVQAGVWVEPRMVDGRLVGCATFTLPDDLPLGWHELHARMSDSTSQVPVVVTPDRLGLPRGLDRRRAWGYLAQLYAVRSRASWGVGDLADLAEIVTLAGRRSGADFVLVNPLAAAEPIAPMTPSPYLPTTRRFVNPMYLRVEDIREAGYLSSVDRALVEWSADPALALDDDPRQIDRDIAWTAKKAALEVVFAVRRSAAREQMFADYREMENPGLEMFALWCALAEKYQTLTDEWPQEARDPSSGFVAAAREELADRVAFYEWLQWVADEQLAAAQRAARESGMRIGIMHDLAVGTHPKGADAWALSDVLAPGASVGAPPDMYNQQGQDWTQPPWHPEALARAGYRPYRDMLRTVLRHAGAIRVDHVLGLFRLWWVPQGCTPMQGAYVRYDHEALVGILALEAYRAGAIVIGEDLGTVDPWVRDYLAERGILGTSILWFEKDGPNPRPPEHYRHLALASVTTHDLPPTAGYLANEHVALRARLGLLTEPASQVAAEADDERERMLAALRRRGLLGEQPAEREVVEALHRWILASPAVLVGVSLADAVGERRAQNQPGTDLEYPNWKVPLADSAGRVVLIDDLFDNPRLRSLAAVMDRG